MPNTRANPRNPDSPFVTPEGMRTAKTFHERFPGADPAMKRVIAEPKTEDLPLTLPKELVFELRSTGDNWPKLAEEFLREGLNRRHKASKKLMRPGDGRRKKMAA